MLQQPILRFPATWALLLALCTGLCAGWGSLVIRDLLESFKIRLEITMSRAKTRSYTPLNVTIDGCEFLQSGSNVNILRLVLDALKSGSSSFPKSCPLQPGSKISIERFYLDPESFPPYLSPTDLQFALGLAARGREVFDARLKGSVFAKKTKKRTS